jgi:membrane-bound metal-dependent hydrolase YbcI (DUF457 family)
VLAVVHSAAGAWLSKAARSRRQAILLGIVSHVVVDFLGHEEPFDEDGSPRLAVLLPDVGLTVIAITWLGSQRGWLSPSLLGAMATILPDVEHFLPLSRGSHKKLFPSHRFENLLHSKTGFKPSLNVQFLLGGLLWLLLALWERHGGLEA